MTGKNSVSANIDQQVLDRIIKEVFEKINSSRSEIPVEKIVIHHLGLGCYLFIVKCAADLI